MFFTNGADTVSNVFVPTGAAVLQGAGALATANNVFIVNPGASIVLDNTANNVNNRMGGRGVWTAGNWTIYGNVSNPTTEVLSQGGNNFAIGNNSGTSNAVGEAVITLVPNALQSLTVQVASTSTSIFNRTVAQSTLLIRGTNLGGTPGTGVANIIGNGTSLGYSGNNGQVVGQLGAFGTGNTGIYPWALVNTSATGNGIAFATYANNTNGIVTLPASGGFVTTPIANDNIIPLSSLAFSSTLNINSLTLNSGVSASIASGATLIVQSGGILAIGTDSLTGGTIDQLVTETIFQTPNPDAGGTTTLSLGSVITGTGALTKAGNGTLSLTTAQQYTGNTAINGGTLRLAGGANTVFFTPTVAPAVGATASTISGQLMDVNFGGTLDLDGNNQTLGNLFSTNTIPGTGGTVLNSSTSTAATLYTGASGNNTWAGNISAGPGLSTQNVVNLVKAGGFTATIESSNTLTGSVTLLGGLTNLVEPGRTAQH